MKLAFTAAVVLAALGATPALASSDDRSCGNTPRDQWMSEDAVRTRATELGYQVRSVEIEDGCYEVYAVDKNGARAELYLNPVSGDVVRTKEDD